MLVDRHDSFIMFSFYTLCTKNSLSAYFHETHKHVCPFMHQADTFFNKLCNSEDVFDRTNIICLLCMALKFCRMINLEDVRHLLN